MKALWLIAALLIGAALSQDDSCYQNPANASCARFTIPNQRIENSLALLCTSAGGNQSMPNMAGCSVSRICAQMSAETGGVYCTPFSILLDVCTDMPGMNGCQDYKALCTNTSVVAQCKTPRLALPSGAQLRNAVSSICNDMWMDGCEQCIQNNKTVPCDSFLVYSNLCSAMPDMRQCGLWSSYCTSVPTWTICGGDPDNPYSGVEMKMYWHTTINDYILFKSWVPRSAGEYVGTLVACVVFAVAYEAFKAFIHWLENKWKIEQSPGRTEVNGKYVEAETLLGEMSKVEVAPFDARKDFIRSFLHMVYYGMHYWVMLLAMTFNVGVFFAVLLGHFIGYLAFGRFSRLVRVQQSCCD